MTRYLKTALLAAAALLASCIHNDIPYPVVEPDGVVRGLQGFIPSPAARYKSRQAENRPKPISSCFHIRNL